MKKKLLTILLCFSLLMLCLGGCSSAAKPDDTASVDSSSEEAGHSSSGADETSKTEASHSEDGAEESSEPSSGAASEEQAEQSTENEDETEGPWFTFEPKVTSVYMEEIFGEEMIRTWYNLVDAALAGEDTFECPDQWTYDWIMGQFPDRYFPVLKVLITQSAEPVENGVAHIAYTTSREEFEEKVAEFERIVENIINETMRPEYTDLEKALSLYSYFSYYYSYDYETLNLDLVGEDDYTCAYRFLTQGTGICREIANAYSYLLMEVGVDATTMSGERTDMNHQWTYVRINGHNFHIDPTYALDYPDNLAFFMMTDDQRAEDVFPETFVVTSNFTQEYGAPDYIADDDTFAPIWQGWFDSFDHDSSTLRYHTSNDAGELVYHELNYSGY